VDIIRDETGKVVFVKVYSVLQVPDLDEILAALGK
jgi:hypothetical protein